MNNKAVTLSIIMAVLAIFFVEAYVSSIEEEGKKKYGTEITVVIARRDIKEMETLNETMIELKNIPKTFLEPAAISSDKKDDKETPRILKGLVGTIALVPIKKGEQLTFNKLTEPSMRTGLATQIAPGRRAVSIPVNEINGVSKLIKPGDRVDVVAIIDPGGGKENKIAKTILQDVVILSTGKYITNNVARTLEADPFGGKDKVRSLVEDFSFTSVTLELEAPQAQMMALITGSGDSNLVLTLRNNDDQERYNLPAVGFAELLGADAGRLKIPGKK
jgi:pilus assembly protein CpaB